MARTGAFGAIPALQIPFARENYVKLLKNINILCECHNLFTFYP